MGWDGPYSVRRQGSVFCRRVLRLCFTDDNLSSAGITRSSPGTHLSELLSSASNVCCGIPPETIGLRVDGA